MDVKELGKRITQEENKLEEVKQELEKKMQTRDAINAEITKKTTDFEVYMSQRDAENKRIHSELNAQREDLARQKSEFQEILKAHLKSKSDLVEEYRLFEVSKMRHSATTKSVQDFIMAVKRAVNVLDI